MRLIAPFVSLAINRFDSGSLSLCSVLDIGGRDSAGENSYLRHRGDPLEPLQTQTISEKTFLKSRTILRRCFVRGFGGRGRMRGQGGIEERTKETRNSALKDRSNETDTSGTFSLFPANAI